MKKKQDKHLVSGIYCPKLKRIMRITAFFLICCALYVSAETYSQTKVFSFTMKNASIEEVLSVIKKNSEYSFFYEDSQIDLSPKVSVSAKKETVSSILDKVLTDKNISYKIENKHIILYKAEQKSQQANNKISIKGQVFDKQEPPSPLPGVTIQIKGSNQGVATDLDGLFHIEAQRDDILVFSYIGYKPVEYLVKRHQSNLIISLEENISALEEVIVTGFTEERKLNSISSISQVKLDATLNNKPITSLSQALQGGVTGITVTQSSGLPGGDAAIIKIRGVTMGNLSPLVLVDGIPMDMDNLDPTTIESVTVLKDAAAAAIYGARAANGVIVVKTKRGQPGKIKVSYNGYGGVQKATYMPDFVNAPTYMRMMNEAYKNNGGDPVYTKDAIQKTIDQSDPYKYPDTNWTDLLWKNATIQSHSISVYGGSSIARFAITGNYMAQTGYVKDFTYDRLNLRANTTVSLRENITVGVDLNVIRGTQHKASVDGATGAFNPIWLLYWTPPTIVGKYPQREGDPNEYYGNYGSSMRNPLAQIEKGGFTENLTDNISVNLQPKWGIIPGLNLAGQFSYQVNSGATKGDRRAVNFFDYDNGQLIATWANFQPSSTWRSSYYYIGGTVDYTKTFHEKHRLFAIAGVNAELNNSGVWDEYAMQSLLAKANYTYDDRYLFEATIRRDGSSRFGPGNKFGWFPSGAIGWNVNKESFLKEVKWINNLKLRGSYGLLGNENIGAYKYQSTIDPGNGSEIVFGNPDISWEKVAMFNTGVDFSIFNNMIDITFDYYDKLTSDIILRPPLSAVGGIGQSDINAGEIRNKGWEFSMNYMQTFGDWSVSAFGGISRNKNKIEKLPGGPYDGGSHIDKEGHALSSHYRYVSNGLLQESDFILQSDGSYTPKEGIVIIDGQQPGDIRYMDLDGDKMITANDRKVMGNGEPDFNYFANLSLNWKNIDFEIMLQGVSGVDAYYGGVYSDPIGNAASPQNFHLDYWTKENPNARFPRLTPTSGDNGKSSDYWFFDASYCRVKYIQLGYTLPSSFTNRYWVSNLRFFVNLQNPFTIAKENKIDPESRGGESTYPLSKTYSAGINISF